MGGRLELISFSLPPIASYKSQKIFCKYMTGICVQRMIYRIKYGCVCAPEVRDLIRIHACLKIDTYLVVGKYNNPVSNRLKRAANRSRKKFYCFGLDHTYPHATIA